MIRTEFAEAFVLTGPTGSGKSDIALSLAEQLDGEIVSMDSMMLYRGMDIGTAKPSAEEQARVPHHLIDVLEPWESASVADWLDRAAQACQSIVQRDKKPILVGGTPFYLKAVLEGLFDGPPADAAIREQLENEAEHHGAKTLHDRLTQIDPITANRLHVNDLRRVIRALEVWTLTGQPISNFQKNWITRQFADNNETAERQNLPIVALDWPREKLYNRINIRVEWMIEQGWLDEVRRLWQAARPPSSEAAQALGYRDLVPHLDRGSVPRDTIEQIQTRTRQFAKRQMTWFRNWPTLQSCPMDVPDPANRVLHMWNSLSSRG